MEDRKVIRRFRFEHSQCDLLVCCIFDGHGGDDVAEYCSTNFSAFLLAKLQTLLQTNSSSQFKLTKGFFTNLFLDFDKNIQADQTNMGGTTACVTIIDMVNGILYMSHLGDSRALIFRPVSERLLYETKDHTPLEPGEIKRITQQAKTPITNGRVWSTTGKHSINVTRGLGDRLFKKLIVDKPYQQPVCSVCEFFSLDLKQLLTNIEKSENVCEDPTEREAEKSICIYMASDGIWNAKFNRQQLTSLPGCSEYSQDINKQIIQWTRFHSLRPPVLQPSPPKKPLTRRARNAPAPINLTPPTSDTPTNFAYDTSMATSFKHLNATFFPQKDKSTDNMTAILLTVSLSELENTPIPTSALVDSILTLDVPDYADSVTPRITPSNSTLGHITPSNSTLGHISTATTPIVSALPPDHFHIPSHIPGDDSSLLQTFLPTLDSKFSTSSSSSSSSSSCESKQIILEAPEASVSSSPAANLLASSNIKLSQPKSITTKTKAEIKKNSLSKSKKSKKKSSYLPSSSPLPSAEPSQSSTKKKKTTKKTNRKRKLVKPPSPPQTRQRTREENKLFAL